MEKSKKRLIIFFLILIVGLLVRFFLVSKVIVGDLLAYGEWGDYLLKFGTKSLYFVDREWKFSSPNYMPLSMYLFSFLSWLNEQKYYLAIWHNHIRIPPAAFIIYFYEFGKVLLFKLPAILADTFLGILVYKVVFNLTKNYKKAILGFAFFFLNPISIFLSGAWGQTDSLVALLGLLSFILLEKRSVFSLPLMFLGLFLKPSWAIFLPYYIWIAFKKRKPYKYLLIGGGITLVLLVAITYPFSSWNIGPFLWSLKDKLSLPIGGYPKLSISAFNFYTTLWSIDRTFSNFAFKIFSLGSFVFINYLTFKSYNEKDRLSLYKGIFTIGLGSFLFTLAMLERYFFPAFIPLIIISFVNWKELKILIAINLILFANIIWSFYRRGYNEIDHPLTSYNFLGIKILSATILGIYLKLLSRFKIIHSKAF